MYNLKYDADNGLSINFSPLLGWFISGAEGLTSNNVEMSVTQGINQIGKTIQGESVQDKTVTIEGSVTGPSAARRKQLLDTIVPGVGGRLIFDNKYFLDVRPEVSPDISRHAFNARFQFQLRAPYPYWRAIDKTTTMIAGVEPLFSFPINYGDPSVPDYHVFGQRITDGYRNVVNYGSVPVSPIIKFRAVTSLANPQILNINTLEYVRVRKSMSAGDEIIIDMSGQTLRVTGTANKAEENLFGYFDISSTVPFLLRQGSNFIRCEADENRDALECVVYHHTTLAGAYGDDNTFM